MNKQTLKTKLDDAEANMKTMANALAAAEVAYLAAKDEYEYACEHDGEHDETEVQKPGHRHDLARDLEARVLAAVRESSGGARMGNLIAATGIKRATLGGVLRRLIKAGSIAAIGKSTNLVYQVQVSQ